MSKLYYILNDQDRKPSRSVKLNKPAKQYFREAKSFLSCGLRRRRRIIAEIRTLLIQYCQENPDAQLEDLFDAFGTPEELANTLFTPSRAEKLSRKKRARLCLFVLCICLLAVGARFLTLQYQQNQSVSNPTDSNEISVRTYDYKTKHDVDQFPPMIKNVIKYDLNYTVNPDDTIRSAYDSNGNEVAVDESGQPLDPDYPVSKEYRELPDR